MDVAATINELGRTSQGLVTSAELVAAGVSRPGLSRAKKEGAVVRVRRGVYAVQDLPPLPRHLVTETGVAAAYVAHVRAVLLGLGANAAAGTRTAAALYGWGLLVEPRLVEVVLTHGWDLRTKGVRARQRRNAARSRVRVLPGTVRLRMTTPVQTVVDCAVELSLVEAVVVCDSALRARAVTVEELHRATASLRGVRAARQLRRVLDLCDPLSGSVLESVLRVRLVLAGIDGFTTQVVLERVPRVLRVDFCFLDSRLVVETDGVRWHTDVARDQARDNRLAILGWRVLRVTWAQVLHEPEQVLADVRAALAATPALHLSPQVRGAAA